MKVLVVEDNELRRKLLEEKIKQVGFTVVGVESGEQALSILQDLDFGLIISDVNMPGIDGFELAKVVKKDPAKWHVPFLLYSSKSDPTPEDIELAERYGADKYILESGVQGVVNEVIKYLK